MLLDLASMRASSLYNQLLEPDHVAKLANQYRFRGHLGDQDFFTMIGMEHPELFYSLACGWNRQLCTWWRDHGYGDIFQLYYRCDGPVSIYHGNCNTPIPDEWRRNQKQSVILRENWLFNRSLCTFHGISILTTSRSPPAGQGVVDRFVQTSLVISDFVSIYIVFFSVKQKKLHKSTVICITIFMSCNVFFSFSTNGNKDQWHLPTSSMADTIAAETLNRWKTYLRNISGFLRWKKNVFLQRPASRRLSRSPAYGHQRLSLKIVTHHICFDIRSKEVMKVYD